ncbi:MAG: translation initiation factor IF-3 [Malacoplasma sp.]|nr:translation initiation factor IF-3 [Malacoplasma sp.]
MINRFVLNEQIRENRLLIIDSDGTNLGEMTKQEALELAQKQGMDLVLFSTGDKPIAKIIDYGKFVYENKKKNKENKKNQVKVKNKEIKVKPAIGIHDLEVRVKNAKEWLSSGYRIRFVVLTYGRIATKVDLVYELYEKFISMVGDCATIQQPLKKVSNVQYESFLIPAKK